MSLTSYRAAPPRVGGWWCEDPAWRPGGGRLSRILRCSTMGAGVFHGRVRDGIGCIIPAMTTGPPRRILTDGEVFMGLVDGVCWWCFARLGAACGVISCDTTLR